MPEKVAIIGSGNWGSAIARIIGFNAKRHDDITTGTRPYTRVPLLLHAHDARPPPRHTLPSLSEVNMWVFEEQIDGKNLSEIINETHENVKYLPGVKLPENVIAEPNLEKAVTGATLLVFVMPHQFLPKTVPNMKVCAGPVLRPGHAGLTARPGGAARAGRLRPQRPRHLPHQGHRV